MSISCAISSDVARAIDLGACARYRNAPPSSSREYALEGHHHAGVFLLHCRPTLVPYLVRDIEAVAAKADTTKFRELCDRAIATLRTPPVERPVDAFGPNS